METRDEEQDDLAARLDDMEKTCIHWIDRATNLEITISKLSWQLAAQEKLIAQLATKNQAIVARLDRLSIAAGIA